jgi:hypothetical protein
MVLLMEKDSRGVNYERRWVLHFESFIISPTWELYEYGLETNIKFESGHSNVEYMHTVLLSVVLTFLIFTSC